ncbi:MAG: 4-(cytidine 5'-diphospho)-2-C-methyl-D-erythritol kinase [Oscillospiraceae bacterium]|jgi:4-diphosphocytidyl-2-C-methyl-D-erythritol kinase|nr:4-(cytidine 5'-diphospho)-2-C-methyl-D-erythritol kinase [Oscillospiraceae bacterium]
MTELSARERAEAKINLSLDVLGALPGGYHEIYSVMQSVSLADELVIRLTPGAGASAHCPGLPEGAENTAVKAALAFFDDADITGLRAEITIEKRIPTAAGLGGGSADAAAVLRALNRLTETGFSDDRLRELAAAVGSDVPFCVSGGAAIARGRGEILSPLPSLPRCFIVIAKPPFPVSTAEMYREYDRVGSQSRPDTDGLTAAMRSGDLYDAARRVCNVFEDVLPPDIRAEIFKIKKRFMDSGALAAAMSGTGGAVFALFDSEGAAKRAQGAVSRDYAECYLAEPTYAACRK